MTRDQAAGIPIDQHGDPRWEGIDLPVRYLHSPFGPLPAVGPEPVDPGILGWVNLLRFHGVETCQSCQGGAGHAYPEPTIDFEGDRFEGWYAVSIAFRVGSMDGLAPSELRRKWDLMDGEPEKPVWQLVFAVVGEVDMRTREQIRDELWP